MSVASTIFYLKKIQIMVRHACCCICQLKVSILRQIEPVSRLPPNHLSAVVPKVPNTVTYYGDLSFSAKRILRNRKMFLRKRRRGKKEEATIDIYLFDLLHR